MGWIWNCLCDSVEEPVVCIGEMNEGKKIQEENWYEPFFQAEKMFDPYLALFIVCLIKEADWYSLIIHHHSLQATKED